jgi:kynureninase
VIRKPTPIATWSEEVLNAIDDTVGLVVMSQVHWADGYLFDIKAITTKIHHHGGLMVLMARKVLVHFHFQS